MDSLTVFLSAHPWMTLLTGMAVPVVASLTFATYATRREWRRLRQPEPNIWTRVVARVVQPGGDPARRFLYPEFRMVSFVRDEANILGVSVPSREVAQSIAERHGAALREALATEGRADASVLFVAPDDFLLLPA